MSPDPIPLRSVEKLECRTCGAGAPLDEHFCPNCSRILALGRHGDYFSFLGLPRQLNLDLHVLERNFRDLSRKFHPDYYYNAPPQERLASLERSSYLNDAFRVLRNPVSRIEHLLAIEGLPPAKAEEGSAKVPPALLEEVFDLNEELDDIRAARENGADPHQLQMRLAAAREPIEQKRVEHEARLQALSAKWDADSAGAPADQRRQTLEALRTVLLERNYITNLLAAIEREGSGLSALGSAPVDRQEPDAGRHG